MAFRPGLFDAFFLFIRSQVSRFPFLGHTSIRPTSAFLFELKPGVDALFKQTHAPVLWCKMVNFINLEDLIAFLFGFVQFIRSPGTTNRTFFLGVRTHVTAFKPGFLLIVFHTLTAKRKGEFTPFADGEKRMKQPLRGQHIYQRHTKVVVNLLIGWVEVNLWKTYRIFAVLVHPGVQTCVILIFNLPQGLFSPTRWWLPYVLQRTRLSD